MISNRTVNNKIFNEVVPGIPDDLFIRGKVPMTKEEIRVLTLSKLRLKPGHRVLDIGAGTGSISVECAMMVYPGAVYGIEKNPEAIELMRKNGEKFETGNFHIIEGEAPGVLKDFPPVDRIIIGGSGGSLKGIFECCRSILTPEGRVVVNAILLETAYQSLQYMKEYGFVNVDLLMASVARGRELGGKMAFAPLNPIFIVWGEKEE